MAKADLEMALVKSHCRSPLAPEELLELLDMDTGKLMTDHGMGLYQAEEVMTWCKHEAQRYSAQLSSFPQGEKLEESKVLSKRQLDKLILKEQPEFVYATDPRAAESEANAKAARNAYRPTDAMGNLHSAIDGVIKALGNEEAYLELSGIVEDWDHN